MLLSNAARADAATDQRHMMRGLHHVVTISGWVLAGPLRVVRGLVGLTTVHDLGGVSGQQVSR